MRAIEKPTSGNALMNVLERAVFVAAWNAFAFAVVTGVAPLLSGLVESDTSRQAVGLAMATILGCVGMAMVYYVGLAVMVAHSMVMHGPR